MKKTPDTLERFFELRAAGMSFEKIAATLDVSKPTLISWARENQTELQNRKTLALDDTLEKYQATRTARLRLFGERLAALEAEAEKRGTGDIPTPKLYELMALYLKHLREEAAEAPAFVGFKNSLMDMDALDTYTTRETWPA